MSFVDLRKLLQLLRTNTEQMTIDSTMLEVADDLNHISKVYHIGREGNRSIVAVPQRQNPCTSKRIP